MERKPEYIFWLVVALLAPFLLIFLLSGCSGAGYLMENGVGQWKLFNRSKPVSEVLENPRIPESTRHAIELVKDTKAYAVNSLGLKATSNYSSYVDVGGPCVSWAVSASHPILLEEKKWKFPIVGEVPYLGFFKKESAEKEALRLGASENPAPDTWVRCVPAFSSLGWFSDPLYSSMLRGNDRDIIDTVIHESLHATIWVGDSVDFNEKLANFVGLEGSLRYIEKTSGSEALAKAKKEVMGEKLFGDFLNDVVAAYKNEVADLGQKKQFYARLPQRYKDYLAGKKSAGMEFTAMEPKLEAWNNAALLAYANYYSDFSVMEAGLKKCSGDLARFVRWLALEKQKGRLNGAPEEHLSGIVKDSSCVK
jgi:predicted aminopeptidase